MAKSFNQQAFDILWEIEDRHFWFRTRNQVIVACLRRFVPDLADANLLEIGCGNGNVLGHLKKTYSGKILIGGDLFVEGLAYCRRRVDVPLVQLDASHLPFSKGLDVIGMFDVLEHLPYDDAVLREVSRALRPGGHLILTVPAHQFLWSYFDHVSCHQRRYNKRELAQKLLEAGLEVEHLGYYMVSILPFVLLRRWLPTGKHAGDNQGLLEKNSVDLRVYPIINEWLFRLTSVEKHLVLWRSLPFGASLLAIARR